MHLFQVQTTAIAVSVIPVCSDTLVCGNGSAALPDVGEIALRSLHVKFRVAFAGCFVLLDKRDKGAGLPLTRNCSFQKGVWAVLNCACQREKSLRSSSQIFQQKLQFFTIVSASCLAGCHACF